ncbi:MAG TPA: hypothetical protein VH482_00600 [Thermomicrobiales bacterium]|jgi:hypothetical protein
MPASETALPATLDAIAAEIFDVLWGTERGPIPTAVDHAYEAIWRLLITGERKPGDRSSAAELVSWRSSQA